uniref:Uncharacterized protein n=1 Tax=Panagrolaimus sp. PS1159 TaxID=55785 RepID=A0AC35FZR5_9BILA
MEEIKQTLVIFGSPKLYFPSDVFKWMKLKASPKMALKLMKVCKYFQHSNGFPFMVVKDILKRGPTWILVTLDNKRITAESLEAISDKLWIVGKAEIYRSRKAIANLLLNTVVLNIQTLTLCGQNITINEFKLLTDGGTIERCYMSKSTITFENDEIVPLEDILECFPNARMIDFRNKAPSFNSLEAAEAKISSKLEKLTLFVDSKNFDVETLVAYMKNHQKIRYTIWFCRISKVEFDQTIAPSIDKLVQEWSPDYQVPKIYQHEKNDPILFFSSCSCQAFE